MSTISSLFPSGSGNAILVSANTLAQPNKNYMVDTSGGGVTLTLPTSPVEGVSVGIIDAKSSFSEDNKCVIARNGEKIMGVDDDMEIAQRNESLQLTYSSSLGGWRISSITPTAVEQIYLTNLNRKNVLINGGFDVWQRGTATFTGSTGGTVYTADRWKLRSGNTGDTTVAYSVTSTNTVMTAGLGISRLNDSTWIGQNVEGRGEFWRNRSMSASCRIFNDGAACTLKVSFGGHRFPDIVLPANAWYDYSGSTIMDDDVVDDPLFLIGQSDDADHQIRLFNVQLEFGEQSTDFEFMFVGDTFSLCQRYFQNVDFYRSSVASHSTAGMHSYPLRYIMRESPTASNVTRDALVNCTGVTIYELSTHSIESYPTGGTATSSFRYQLKMQLSAEY